MIDSLEMLRKTIEEHDVYREYGLKKGAYGVVTLHRPANVDNPKKLKQICESLSRISEKFKLIFPIHPRTRKNLEQNAMMLMLKNAKNIPLLEPLGYIRFMNLVFNCRLVITDSGGIQEETTYLGIPCLTLRGNTERPITITQGTNRLCNVNNLVENVNDIIDGHCSKRKVPELWDGHTAERVVQLIKVFFEEISLKECPII